MLEKIKLLREKAKENGNPVLRDKSFDLLMETIKKHQPKKILEVGVNVGLTGISMLLHSKEATLTGIEIDEDVLKEARTNYQDFNLADRVKFFIGDASEIIPVLTGEYDFIFLDGPKGHYYEYALNLIPLLKKGGILFADNVLFRGYVYSRNKIPHRYNTTKNSMERFLNYLQNDNTLRTQIIDIEDGVSITEKL